MEPKKKIILKGTWETVPFLTFRDTKSKRVDEPEVTAAKARKREHNEENQSKKA